MTNEGAMLSVCEVEGEISIGVDVDGTLTNERLGEEIMVLTPEQIKKRYAKCTLKKGAEILFEGDYNVFAITGRREIYRDITIDWFNLYGIPYEELVMVPDNFYVGGYSVEKYVGYKVDSHIQRDIRYALDDNIYVIDALQRNGIYAHKVDGDFREAFDKIISLHYYNQNYVENVKMC